MEILWENLKLLNFWWVSVSKAQRITIMDRKARNQQFMKKQEL